jgi:hypothetical protein
MHRKQIFRIVIGIVSFIAVIQQSSGNTKLMKNEKKLDVYLEFQNKVTQLEVELKNEKSSLQKHKVFLKSFKELGKLRKDNPRQKEENEIEMSLFMETLLPLPGATVFNPKNCPDYIKNTKSAMKTYNKEEKEPSVERAIALVQLICQ